MPLAKATAPPYYTDPEKADIAADPVVKYIWMLMP